MKQFNLADQFRDAPRERRVLAALARDPNLYWEYADLLAPDTFAHERGVWERLSLAIGQGVALDGIVPEASPGEASQNGDWQPSTSPRADAEKLADLHQRRLLAAAQERLADALHNDSVDASDIAQRLEEEAAKVQQTIRQLASGRATYASDLVARVVEDARERWDARQDTGKPVMGISSGIPKLDQITGGWEEGLALLGAGPGVGKTTTATQMAKAAAREGVPVVFATFENSPSNLVLKMVCSHGRINTRDVRRGYADPDQLASAAVAIEPVLRRIALIEGTGRLTVAQLRARALQAMNHHGTDKCLVIVDYLQLWAKASAELRGMLSARERIEALSAELGQLARRLKNPVLAIVSQNREKGAYGANGSGGATLDSLKESGDLEYAADLVMFLTRSQERTAIEPNRAIDLTVAKNRNGELGKVEMTFRADVGTMAEYTAQRAP